MDGADGLHCVEKYGSADRHTNVMLCTDEIMHANGRQQIGHISESIGQAISLEAILHGPKYYLLSGYDLGTLLGQGELICLISYCYREEILKISVLHRPSLCPKTR